MAAMTVFPEQSCNAIRFGLFEPTLDYAGTAWDADVLHPWVGDNRSIVAALQQVGRPDMASVTLDPADLWALYALSRVAELLVLPHQPPARDPDSPSDWLPKQAYEQFVTAIGGTSPLAGRFHPFLHEIVAVETADDRREPPSLTAQWWPGCLVGGLVLLRAGITVRAGADHFDPVVATQSVMYWAWRRRHRPVQDLSHGWGGNSQWRTEFRRDYLLSDRLAYNVDAALEPKPQHPGGMPHNDDLDLLRYRCSTLVDHGDEQWVWESHHSEPVPPDFAA